MGITMTSPWLGGCPGLRPDERAPGCPGAGGVDGFDRGGILPRRRGTGPMVIRFPWTVMLVLFVKFETENVKWCSMFINVHDAPSQWQFYGCTMFYGVLRCFTMIQQVDPESWMVLRTKQQECATGIYWLKTFRQYGWLDNFGFFIIQHWEWLFGLVYLTMLARFWTKRHWNMLQYCPQGSHHCENSWGRILDDSTFGHCRRGPLKINRYIHQSFRMCCSLLTTSSDSRKRAPRWPHSKLRGGLRYQKLSVMWRLNKRGKPNRSFNSLYNL